MKTSIKFGLSLVAMALASAAQAVPIPGNTLEGKIVDWPKGQNGELRVVRFTGGGTVWAAPIDENGNFSLKIPDYAASDLLPVSGIFGENSNFGPGDGCKAEGKADPAANTYQTYWFHVMLGADHYGDITFDNFVNWNAKKGDVQGSLFYFDKPTTLSGKLVCGAWQDTYNFSGTFPAGWQMVYTDMGPGPNARSRTSTYNPTTALPKLEWRLFQEYGGTGVYIQSNSAIVDRFVADSPAEKAGLKAGDQILSINGKEVKGYADTAALRGDPNSEVILTVKRAGQDKPITVKFNRTLVRFP